MSRLTLLVLLHLGVVLLPMALLWPLPVPDDVVVLRAAQFTPGPSEAGAEPLPVHLPHNWRDGSAPEAMRGRYRFELPAVDEEQPLWALYLPRHRFVAEVSLNGTLVGRTGRVRPPISRQHFTPALLELPSALLRSGDNRLVIELVSDPVGLGFLAAPMVGPEASLAPLLRRQTLLDITVPWLLAAGVGVLGGVILLLAAVRAAEPGWGWFGVLCLSLSVSISNRFLTDPPVPVWVWERVVFLAAFWVAVAGLAFALSFNRQRQPVRLVPAVGLVVTVVFALLPFDSFMLLGQYVLTPVTIGVGMAALVMLLRSALPDVRAQPLLFTLPTTAMLAAATHDALMVLNVVQERLEYLLPFASILLVLSMAILLVHRLVEQARSLAQLNSSLEARLAQREAELEESFQSRQAAETRAATLQERAQLTRDLHDGLGSRLLSLQHLAERHASHDELHDAAAEALRELRLLATPLRSNFTDPGSLLGQFREERLRPLERRGFAVHWDVDETRAPAGFGPAMAVELQRLLHEVLANALRHGSGTDLAVTLVEEDDTLLLRLANSVGITPGATERGAGTGLAGMALRAERMGAELHSRLDGGQWVVEVRWPALVAGVGRTW